MIRRKRLKTGNEGWLTSYADLITNLLIFFILIMSASELQMGKLESIASAFSQTVSPKSLKHAEKVLAEEIAKQNLSNQVEVKITDSGLEISFNSGVTFASGGADVLPQMIQPLTKVMALLPQYADRYKFAVEGHTDEEPVKKESVFRSNWDLAAARALQVRDLLEKVGLPSQRIRVEAYADTKPLATSQLSGLSHEQILAKHRRVIIRLF
jgi:chemotaxis protein MotB